MLHWLYPNGDFAVIEVYVKKQFFLTCPADKLLTKISCPGRFDIGTGNRASAYFYHCSHIYIWSAGCEKVPYNVCDQHSPRSACASAKSDQA